MRAILDLVLHRAAGACTLEKGMVPEHVFKLEALLEADAVAFELFMFNRPQSTRDIA